MGDVKMPEKGSLSSGKRNLFFITLGFIATNSVFILFVTLYPFRFSVNQSHWLQQLSGALFQGGSPLDQVANVVLFIPLGVGLTCFTHFFLARADHRVKLKWKVVQLVTVLLFSLSLSLTVEVLQVFLPGRTSSISDVVTNTMGGVLGFSLFQIWTTISPKLRVCIQTQWHQLSIQKMALGFIAYVTLMILATTLLQGNVSLNNWEETFPLLIGNEQTGDRPWSGSVTQLEIADKAIAPASVAKIFAGEDRSKIWGDSLVADYPLITPSNQRTFPESTGQSPVFRWRGEREINPPQAAIVSPQGWLETKQPMQRLTQRLQATSQFTINLVASTGNTNQAGPARILSVSRDPYHRNLTLGQDGQDLVIRLRTSLSGQNGTYPTILIQRVFADTTPHHLVLTYGQSVLKVYIDSLKSVHRFEITPASIVMSYVFPLMLHNLQGFRLVYYGLIYIPLGCLLAIIASRLRGGLRFQLFLFLGGAILPVLLLELTLWSITDRPLQSDIFLISFGLLLSTFVVCQAIFKNLLRRKLKTLALVANR